VACVLALMLVVRPLAHGDRHSRLTAQPAPEGLAGLAWPHAASSTAAVASLFALRLDEAGVPGAGQLQGLVFLTILMTVGIQGLTAAPLAKLLGLVRPAPSEKRSGRRRDQRRFAWLRWRGCAQGVSDLRRLGAAGTRW